MKTLAIILIIEAFLLNAFAQSPFKYEPIAYKPYEKVLSGALGKKIDLSNIRILSAPYDVVNVECGKPFLVIACAFYTQDIILTTNPSDCELNMHEFLHFALVQIGAFHESSNHTHFLYQGNNLAKLCKQMRKEF